MSRRDGGGLGAAGDFLGAGSTFLAEIGVFAGLGWWLDGRFGTTPWLLVAGIPIGLSLATWHLLRLSASWEGRRAEEEKEEERDG
ncbi:MAG: AtpZ/AtpI family protein [Planctomycetota bacterium]